MVHENWEYMAFTRKEIRTMFAEFDSPSESENDESKQEEF
jgi:hypothetical protein